MAVATLASATYAPTATALWQQTVGTMQLTETDRQIAAHIRKLVRTRFRTTYALAKKIGVHPSTLYKILGEKRGVGTDVLKRLHDGLIMSADEFLDDKPEERYWKPSPEDSRKGRRPSTEQSAISEPRAARHGSGR